jgi:triosephosphate isomerase
LGAQHCSPFAHGAYTGQVDALSLAQLGCAYGIVGHSETRLYFHYTDQDIAQSIIQLLTQAITPIICIGETAQERSLLHTHARLEQQLNALAEALTQFQKPSYILAYEPIWAIGTDITPTKDELLVLVDWLNQYLDKAAMPAPQAIIYGGSVNPISIGMLKGIDRFNGFLIGSASLDFQTVEKIVSW